MNKLLDKLRELTPEGTTFTYIVSEEANDWYPTREYDIVYYEVHEPYKEYIARVRLQEDRIKDIVFYSEERSITLG